MKCSKERENRFYYQNATVEFSKYWSNIILINGVTSKSYTRCNLIRTLKLLLQIENIK